MQEAEDVLVAGALALALLGVASLAWLWLGASGAR
jgi:hypothetical protein